MMKKTTVFAWAGGFAFALIAGLAIKQLAAGQGFYAERYEDGRVIPLNGLLVNPHGLDDLDFDAEEDLRRLGKALIAYQSEKGQLPDDPKALIKFTESWPEADRVQEDHFGSQDHVKTDSGFENPDRAADRARMSYQFVYRAASALGPAARRIRERDGAELWIVAYEYVRSNRMVFRDGSQTTRPEGHCVALWSTGEVQRVPLTDEVIIPTGPNEWSVRFRGEKGISRTAPPANKPERTQWTGRPNQ